MNTYRLTRNPQLVTRNINFTSIIIAAVLREGETLAAQCNCVASGGVKTNMEGFKDTSAM